MELGSAAGGKASGRLTGYWDAGYTYWFGDKTSSNHSLSFSPGVRLRVRRRERAALHRGRYRRGRFHQHRAARSNDLGSSFQFEDRLGFGLRFAGQEIGVRAIHYSNAGIKQPNDGAETYTLHYRTAF